MSELVIGTEAAGKVDVCGPVVREAFCVPCLKKGHSCLTTNTDPDGVFVCIFCEDGELCPVAKRKPLIAERQVTEPGKRRVGVARKVKPKCACGKTLRTGAEMCAGCKRKAAVRWCVGGCKRALRAVTVGDTCKECLKKQKRAEKESKKMATIDEVIPASGTCKCGCGEAVYGGKEYKWGHKGKSVVSRKEKQAKANAATPARTCKCGCGTPCGNRWPYVKGHAPAKGKKIAAVARRVNARRDFVDKLARPDGGATTGATTGAAVVLSVPPEALDRLVPLLWNGMSLEQKTNLTQGFINGLASPAAGN